MITLEQTKSYTATNLCYCSLQNLYFCTIFRKCIVDHPKQMSISVLSSCIFKEPVGLNLSIAHIWAQKMHAHTITANVYKQISLKN